MPSREPGAGVSSVELYATALVAGVAVGCMYALVALGYNLVYNATGVFNFAGQLRRARRAADLLAVGDAAVERPGRGAAGGRLGRTGRAVARADQHRAALAPRRGVDGLGHHDPRRFGGVAEHSATGLGLGE